MTADLRSSIIFNSNMSLSIHCCVAVLLILFQACYVTGGSSCSCLCSSSSVGSDVTQGPIGGGRIFAGESSSVGGRPFQVGLVYGRAFCGGSIYNSRTIITAAHCLPGKGDVSTLRVFLGTLVTPATLFKENEKFEKAVEVIPHPDWRKGIGSHDIGIIRLGAPIQYNSYIQPIGVVEPGIDLSGKVALVSGWGRISAYNEAPMPALFLREATGTIISRTECENRYSSVSPTISVAYWPEGVKPFYKVICVLASEADGPLGQGSCKGDSGGPLTCQVGGAVKLCGVVAGGYGGCGIGNPDIYTEVNDPEIFKWILDNAGEPDTPTENYDLTITFPNETLSANITQYVAEK